MRLFYIIIFFLFSINFAGFASQEKNNIALNKSPKISFISSKKQVKVNSDFSRENDRLQKDFLNNGVLKISHTPFILLTFLVFLFLKNKTINAKVVIKRLKFNYWCLFNMFYPKHVFW